MYSSLRGGTGFSSFRRLADFTERDEEELARRYPPFVEESDTGPADAWRWAYQDENCQDFNYPNYRSPLRQRGYCMWDRARLDEWHILEHPWHRPIRPKLLSGETFHRERAARDTRMQESWRIRCLIYKDGGRGWWSMGDESKVIWPPGGEAQHSSRLERKRRWLSIMSGMRKALKALKDLGTRLLQKSRLTARRFTYLS
jgi:hypothetical protein